MGFPKGDIPTLNSSHAKVTYIKQFFYQTAFFQKNYDHKMLLYDYELMPRI